jgi:hypothetical protein
MPEPGWTGVPHGNEPWPPMNPPAPGPITRTIPAIRDSRSMASPLPSLVANFQAEMRAPGDGVTVRPVRFYVGDGVYKTAPATASVPASAPSAMPTDVPAPRLQAHGTVFEEDLYSKDLNLMAKNGTWGGPQ